MIRHSAEQCNKTFLDDSPACYLEPVADLRGCSGGQSSLLDRYVAALKHQKQDFFTFMRTATNLRFHSKISVLMETFLFWTHKCNTVQMINSFKMFIYYNVNHHN